MFFASICESNRRHQTYREPGNERAHFALLISVTLNKRK